MKWENKDWEKDWNGIEYYKMSDLDDSQVESFNSGLISGENRSKRLIDELPPSMRERYQKNMIEIEKSEQDEKLKQMRYRLFNANMYSSLGWKCCDSNRPKGNKWVEKDEKTMTNDKKEAENYFLEAYKRGDLSAGIGMATICYSRLAVNFSDEFKIWNEFLNPHFSSMYFMKDEDECKDWLASVINTDIHEIYKFYDPVMSDSLYKKWFNNHVAFAHLEAMYLMACMCAEHINMKDKYKKEVVEWLERAANEGHIRAMEGLGYMYETQEAPLVTSTFSKWIPKKDKEKAAKYYQQALNADPTQEKIIASTAKIRLSTIDDKCFITTAVCNTFGKPDNCYELTMFRNFRDNWLLHKENGSKLVEEYYNIAPLIVEKINNRADATTIYSNIWSIYLKPCLTMIEEGKNSQCEEMYTKMVYDLQKKYLFG